MKDKGHFTISLIKSILRILACVFVLIVAGVDPAVKVFASGLLVAELLGILEEIADKRK